MIIINTEPFAAQYEPPKGVSFDDIPNEQIQKIALWINSKPRKELGYRTSREVFHSTNYHLL